MKQTEQYQLSQWEKSDRILMEDFNADNAKIEAALLGLGAMIRPQVITTSGAQGELRRINSITSRINWGLWEDWACKGIYVTFPTVYPDEYAEAAATDIKIFLPGSTTPIATVPQEPFLLLFFTRYDQNRNFEGMVFCRTPAMFIRNIPFSEAGSFSIHAIGVGAGATGSKEILSPTFTFLGWE